jgi:glycosyltransferase involved in cell wall biosynthesis
VKVLWLTPIQLPAVEGVPATSGGWIEGLRRALEKNEPRIELVIASAGPVSHEPFRQGNAEYHVIAPSAGNGRFHRVRQQWSHAVVPAGAVEGCRRVIDAVAPDLVHVHGSENFLGLALRGCGIPSVVSLQGIASAYRHHFAAGLGPSDLARAVCDPAFFRGLGLVHEYLRYDARVACEGEVFRNCRDFLGRTHWDRQVLALLLPGARYHHVDEVLNDVFYGEPWKAVDARDSVIYCTTRSSPMKDLSTLLEAVAILRRTTRPHLRLRVGGSVKRGAVWPSIRRRLALQELRGAVDLLGLLSPNEIAGELRSASLFVHPSHIDNSPNALCEALLLGVPSVASDVGGIPTLATDGESALLYPDRDPFMLAAAVDRLLSDRHLAAQLGRAARAEALIRHDPKRIAQTVAEVYAEVIGGSGKRSGPM